MVTRTVTDDRNPGDAFFCQPGTVGTGLVAGEILAAILTLAADAPGNAWETFGLNSLLVQWVVLVSVASLCLLQRRWSTLALTPMAILALLVVLTTTLLACVAVVLVAPADALGNPLSFVLRASGIALAVTTLAFLSFRSHLHAQHLVARAKQAELEALQARIHPHFLFNTLNSAAALVHARPGDAERVLLDMSDLFRAALSKPGWVSLEREIDLCRRYLDIEQLRFGERLAVEWHVKADAAQLAVPLLTLQPLVENAVAHGVGRDGTAKSVIIQCVEDSTALTIIVTNPVGTGAETTVHGHQVGLASVRSRVEAATRGEGRIEANRDADTYVAKIVLPKSSMPPRDQATTR